MIDDIDIEKIVKIIKSKDRDREEKINNIFEEIKENNCSEKNYKHIKRNR